MFLRHKSHQIFKNTKLLTRSASVLSNHSILLAQNMHQHQRFFSNEIADSNSNNTSNNIDYYNPNSFDKDSIQNAQADDTGRTRTYMALGAGKAMYVSAARLTVMKFIASLSASADVLALGSIEIDTNTIPEGQSLVTKWRGKPVFVRHRTQAEVDEVRKVPVDSLRDQQTDEERTNIEQPKWLVVLGVCTHLGCVPIDDAGDYNAWFCPCHGSHYDRSGRIRKGPAPLNLEVPTWKFMEDNTTILLG